MMINGIESIQTTNVINPKFYVLWQFTSAPGNEDDYQCFITKDSSQWVITAECWYSLETVRGVSTEGSVA